MAKRLLTPPDSSVVFFPDVMQQRDAAAYPPDLPSRVFIRAIRRQNYFNGLRQALGTHYPVVKRLLGDDSFYQTANAYIQRVSAHTGDIRHYGADFADFLAHHAATPSLPHLTDAARLDWLVHRLGHSTTPLHECAHFTTLPPDRWSAQRFCLHPACALFASDYPVHRLWLAYQSVAPVPVELDAGSVHLLICRTRAEIDLRALLPAEYALLNALTQALPLAAAIERARATSPDFDHGAALARYQHAWIHAAPSFAEQNVQRA